MAKDYELGPTRRFVNSLMAGLTRRGWGPKTTFLLTTIGHRSGEERTTPVIPVDLDGNRYLVSPYGDVGWVHNIRASGRATLTRGKQVDQVEVEEVGADEAGPVLRDYVNQAKVTAPFFDADRKDPVEAFVAEAAKHPVFRILPPAT
jgi:deazaflavin-dependent oxidoreductase (nitroreductase family)